MRSDAIGASPLLLTLFATGFGAFMGGIGLFLFVVAMPGALIYGALVRLRPSGGQRFIGHPISD